MFSQRSITFVVAVRRRGEVLQNNFLASPCLREPHPYDILIQESFPSAGKAFNDAIDRSVSDLLIFVHQDIILPESWPSQFDQALTYLEADDPNWGVLGCYGETLNDKERGYVYSIGCGTLGQPFDHPEQIQTLDEIVLILRKSSGLRFDETLPHFHFYGTDICMQSEQAGRKNYSIPAFCIHNTDHNLILDPSFYECYWHVKRNWKKCLPIQTTCIRMTKFDIPLYGRRLGEMYLKYIRRKQFDGTRTTDIQHLLREANMSLEQSATGPSS